MKKFWKKKDKIPEPEKKLSPITKLFPDDIIIAVIGPTGSGKSTFINTLTGFETAGVGHDLESCTKEISNFRHSLQELAYGDLVFVDTPGFDDTPYKSDADILKMVADWLKTSYDKDTKLSGLLYFHRISDNRMTWTPLLNIGMFKELCGKDALQNVVLVTTMWNVADKEVQEAREEELKTNPKYWRAMLAQNSTTSRFMRTRESAFNLMDPLIDIANKRSSILLQEEMLNMRKELPLASAGQELFSKMEHLVRQREDLQRRVRAEMKRANRDKTILQRFQEEHQKLKDNFEWTMDEMRRLKLPLGQLLLNMTDKFFTSNGFRCFSITGTSIQ